MHFYKKFVWILAVAAVCSIAGTEQPARADHYGNPPWTHWDRAAYRHARRIPWHGVYYNQAYGAPLALVVPPTANNQSNYGWGVGSTRMTPIYHQYMRPYPGDYGGPGWSFLPTPNWPSDTTDFGVYYIRGPW